MKTTLLHGRPAYSKFRQSALQNGLKALNDSLDIGRLEATEVYLIRHEKSLTEETTAKIFNLLEADRFFQSDEGFFVAPRKGTISPWSSKASDIFRNCGIESISRVERSIFFQITSSSGKVYSRDEISSVAEALFDRMTEQLYDDIEELFVVSDPAPLRTVPLKAKGRVALEEANEDWGLAMSNPEIDYLLESYQRMDRDPTDAELVMFSQVNSEHCRHKIFNAQWTVDGETSELSLFDMIRNTHNRSPEGTLVAYSDNSSVLEGFRADWWQVEQESGEFSYESSPAQIDLLCKVETHNHPTAISPFPGAATGVGGEIRDEGATGIGGRPKAGLAAFVVSHLRLEDFAMPWESIQIEHPKRLATPKDIMLEAPIGGAAFGNEFGRPQLCGVFRTLELDHAGRYRGYHKPIMAAGGIGNLKREHVSKKPIPTSALIIQLGGPSMKIGLGGGAASSIAAGAQSEALDFDSVQRGNPEMERRCQQVIDGCIALGSKNPMLSIHDIGAGGLSNGLPELVEETGGHFKLRNIHSEDPSMSPMEIWCNESQERYVMAIMPASLEQFRLLCERERCPFAVVGEATDDNRLVLEDSAFGNNPIEMDMDVLLGKTPRLVKDVQREPHTESRPIKTPFDLKESIEHVLRFPAVANKKFLITIADRSITGMVARDQMVGPWQTPVADVAVTTTTMESTTGEAMAIGERTPIAIIDSAASGRMAVGECLTNIIAADIEAIGDIKLSANWMVAAGEDGEDANLFDTVRAVGMELCPALGISIPVGKDSMSMRTSWTDSSGKSHKQVSPLSLMVTGFAPVRNASKTLTPDLKSENSRLILIDLSAGNQRMGGSVFAQANSVLGEEVPNFEDPNMFLGFFRAMHSLKSKNLLLSYHDRSDGGLAATLIEMAIAGRKGIHVELEKYAAGNTQSAFESALFNEELGAVIEVAPESLSEVLSICNEFGLESSVCEIATVIESKTVTIAHSGKVLYQDTVTDLNRIWSELSFRMQALRDNPACAREEFDQILDEQDLGLLVEPKFDIESVEQFTIGSGVRPKVAVLRDQGINGQNEMAFAFHRAGFESIDVHMTDLFQGRHDLANFSGLVACGGFSYGDVLGAGSGWAKSILFHPNLKEQFKNFFDRETTFTLGVCNGCQMISQLKEIIPGADLWPKFVKNRSEQFEARLSNVEIIDSRSIFFKDMAGSRLPIPVAHGEGRIKFSTSSDLQKCSREQLVAMRYIDSHGIPSQTYPSNPNGSEAGATAFTTKDGRATIMMPHPERLFRSIQMTYRPTQTFQNEAGPWLKMFQNAHSFVS